MNKLTFLRLPTIVFSFLSILVLFAAVVSPQPRIEFEEQEYDWGEAMEGDTITHAFRFQNTGSEILKIEKVRSG